MNNFKIQCSNVSYLLEIERVDCVLIWFIFFFDEINITLVKASMFSSRTLRRGSFTFVRPKYERPSRSHGRKKRGRHIPSHNK